MADTKRNLLPDFFRCRGARAIWLVIALCGCTSQSPPAPADKGIVIVSAAASTKEVIDSLAQDFSASSGAEVKLNTGPSNALATQILAGAPADLFLSANQQWADEVEKGGEASATVKLLTNKLVLVVPKDNPGDVREPKDLLSDKVKKVALAGEKVPAGIYAGQALTKLDLLEKLTAAGKIVRGDDVRTTLNFVDRGEVQAGIVYATDVGAAENVTTVYKFDPSLHDEIVYVLVLLKHGQANAAAGELYKFLQSPKADEAYAKFGFMRVR